MRFAVLGYLDEREWDSWSAAEQNSFLDECFAYDEALKAGGHWGGGEALGSPRDAATVRPRDGEATITDGPFAEAKEVLGGILFLEAADMAEAKELIAKHPGVRSGGFEIRPIVDLAPLVQESEERRRRAAGRA
ncbi:MAG TPA: YciI family protein [Actinomycetota bacterium]|nr:YciI family protein [Actinomycetota bacterium]